MTAVLLDAPGTAEVPPGRVLPPTGRRPRTAPVNSGVMGSEAFAETIAWLSDPKRGSERPTLARSVPSHLLRPDRALPPDAADLAWAAGLFDGEGYIGCIMRKLPRTGDRVPRLDISVPQWKRPEVVIRLCAVMPVGRLRIRTTTHRGTEFTWRANSFQEVQAAVVMLWPWLSLPKREQAHAALRTYHAERLRLGMRVGKRRRGARVYHKR